MEIFSLSTPHCLHTAATFAAKNRALTTTIEASSREPQRPEPPRRPTLLPHPNNNEKPTNSRSLSSTSIRLSNPLKSSSKTPKNPLKNLVDFPHVSPPLPTHNPLSLAAKLRLSSKLNPPPPQPPPPPEIQGVEKNSEDEEDEESETEKNEAQETEFRQLDKIFVGNLPNWIKKHEVAEFFRQFGPIKNVILIKGHHETERNAGFGFVIYDGLTAAKSAMNAVEFDGVEFHGRVLTVKLDDGRRLKGKAEERARWVEGEDGVEHRSKWHEERDGARKMFRLVLESEPENWQKVVTAFERVKKV